MDRRALLTAFATWPLGVRAHHGWSSFDVSRPLYLEGRAANVAWRNPHVEFDLDLAEALRLPADLAQRTLPAQSAAVDGAALLKDARLPTRKDRRWHIELAPLSRIQAWQLNEIKNGDAVSVLGYTFAGEKGAAVLRGEYLWAGGKTIALRSAPA